ncbi:diaminopimelate epimerase [Veillonella sp. VA142]|uniref:diaminopimelate epimerase n=1 Tax=Veillonella sp. VA142 TaxID=741834 RepID=UPI000F8D3923|nr:diaminopimelate epimerase [Veillonella sp. VA142]
MKITKMHGLGNDFIVFFDEGTLELDVTDMAQRLCDRHTGIGADGLVIVMSSEMADVRMRIINSDGSEAEMCGNGIRCFAKYAYDRKIITKDIFTVETLAGIMTPEIIAEDGVAKLVKVNMGKPTFTASAIPMAVEAEKVIDYTIDVDGTSYVVSSVLLGVPHTEVFVDDVKTMPLTVLGPKIEKHPLFPKGTNVNFVQVVNENTVKVRTWERGAGATLACGTGSCSSAVMAHEKGLTGRSVDVELYLGTLHIDYDEDGTVYMTGPAEEVFSLELEGVTC